MRILYVVAGATATGKTQFALDLAQELNGVLINADSRQVYRSLDVGTNKGKLIKKGSVALAESSWDEFYYPEWPETPLWLFDLVNPDESFSVAAYQKLAFQAIKHAFKVGKSPILVGGTGMYLDAVCFPERYNRLGKPDAGDLSKLQELSALPIADLQSRLSPEELNSLNESDRFNPRRLANRILKHSMPLSSIPVVNKPFDQVKRYYTQLPLDILKAKISQRAAEMWQSGLIAETKLALEKYPPSSPGFSGSGYPAVISYSNGEISEELALTKVANAHWKVAKKQLTWFKKYYLPYLT